MNRQKIIDSLSLEVRRRLDGESSGHDWWHVYRVWQTAKAIALEERANMFVVELAALLHDIADWKLHGGDEMVGPRVARELCNKFEIPDDITSHVCQIIPVMSFKGAGTKSEMVTLEGKIVQDADRLDAIGAIGIARAFAYGGHKNRAIHIPSHTPVMHQTKDAFVNNTSPTIAHFHEKLLLLKERMNTNTAKKLAEGRHHYMEEYLNRFHNEWEGVV